MTIKVGDSIPDSEVFVLGEGGPEGVSASKMFAGKKVAVFGVPGAFTRTCSAQHLPGFVNNADAIKAKGIDAIAVTSVNDAFVMDAWKGASGAEGKVDLFLADGNGDFAKATGLHVDDSDKGRGIRSRRYSMIVEDGVVTVLNIEETSGKAEISGAENLIKQL